MSTYRIDICDYRSSGSVIRSRLMPTRFGARYRMIARRCRSCTRILRPGGMAIIMVPLEEGLDETYENPSTCVRGRPIDPFRTGGPRSLLWPRPSRSTAWGGIFAPRVGVERALRPQARVEARGTGFPLHASRLSGIARCRPGERMFWFLDETFRLRRRVNDSKRTGYSARLKKASTLTMTPIHQSSSIRTTRPGPRLAI